MVVFCGRGLSLLWSISARMWISLDVVWLKGVFLACTNTLRTPHGLTKKCRIIILEMVHKKFKKTLQNDYTWDNKSEAIRVGLACLSATTRTSNGPAAITK